tara:strand:- start:434 stop:1522 length:1089 start_codon:yes stop_codon:yes gene_type:complete
MSSLLEEAIVDATALKAAALKNAEAVVLERYSSEVRGAVDALLEQETMDPLGLEEDDAADTASTVFMEDVPYAFQNEQIDGPGEEELVEIDFNELKTRIAEEEAAGIESSEADLNDSLEIAEEITNTMLDNDAGEDEAELAGASARIDLEEDEDINLTEDMIADLIEELVSEKVEYEGTPRPQGWASVNSADNSGEQANNDAMAAALAAHSDEEEEEEEVETAPDVVSDAALFEAKISDLKVSTRELRALLIESRDQLTKLNLENAKLVYQNKALNSTSLNERQKTQIAEAVQSANSVEEAKMIYETIQNAVGSALVQRKRPQTLREAVQRPTSLLLNSKKNNEATIDPNMGRMLRLAGLNK